MVINMLSKNDILGVIITYNPDSSVINNINSIINQVSELLIIDNGSDAPGTLLGNCSREFLRCFATADLIIAKGQGNYETLCNEPRNIFFLFKIKCQVIARHIGHPVGTQVLLKSNEIQPENRSIH